MAKKSKTKKSSSKSEYFERIPSGIPGLDKLIEGGFIKGSTNLVSGGAGTGKTILCVQFVLEGLQRGETCMFITLEQRPEDIIKDVVRFGWDLKKYVQTKKLFLTYEDPFQVTDITSPLLDKIQEHKVTRVVIDSTAVLGSYLKDPFDVRKQLFKLLAGLKEIGVTSLLTSELPEDSRTLARFGVEEFVVDGLIILHYLGVGEANYNNLEVRKMRRTNHARGTFQLEFTKNGIKILSEKRKLHF